MAVADIVPNSTGKGVKGDIEPGWSIREDCTGYDILDSSGSTGNISASFKNTALGNVGQTPNSGPTPSSNFLFNQPASFQHPTLGTVSGYITDQTISDGSVSVEMSTILESLNTDIDAPPFVEGSAFYSFQIDPANGTVYDMVVDSAGDIWVAGATNWIYKYGRFGGTYKQRINFGSVNGLRIGMDSSGNLYIMSSLAVTKVNPTTLATSTIINSAAGSFYDMVVDPTFNMIYILTTDTTANQAIKKYNTSGTLQTQWGNYLSGTAGTAPTANSFSVWQGIGVSSDGTVISVASATPILVTANYSSDVQIFTNTGTYGHSVNVGVNTEYNDIRFRNMPTTWVGGTSLTVTSSGISLGDINQYGMINRSLVMPRTGANSAPFGQMGIAADPNGAGLYWGINTTITRLAGGTLSPYQALECYMGMTTFSTRGGTVNYTNLNTTQVNTWDGGLFPAWSGNVWTYVKQLGATRKFILTSSGTQVNVTSLTGTLQRIDISNRTEPPSREIQSATAQSASFVNHNAQSTMFDHATGIYTTQYPIYDAGYDDQVITADYFEVNTTTIQANSYIVAIDPIYNRPGTAWPTNWGSTFGGSFFVCDSSNPPLQLGNGEFEANGGQVLVSASSIPGSLDVTISGPTAPISGFTAPFSLAQAVGTKKVPRLRVTGNAVSTTPQVVPVLTGANSAVTPGLTGQNVDSPFIHSASIGYDTISTSCVSLGSGGETLRFSIPLTASHQLGLIAGSIFLYGRVKWIVMSANITDGVIQITANRYTTISDVTPNNPTMTVAQMDTLWSGYRYADRYISPGIIVQ